MSNFLELPHGIASHDTFGRILQIIDSQALERVCIGPALDMLLNK